MIIYFDGQQIEVPDDYFKLIDPFPEPEDKKEEDKNVYIQN